MVFRRVCVLSIYYFPPFFPFFFVSGSSTHIALSSSSRMVIRAPRPSRKPPVDFVAAFFFGWNPSKRPMFRLVFARGLDEGANA